MGHYFKQSKNVLVDQGPRALGIRPLWLFFSLSEFFPFQIFCSLSESFPLCSESTLVSHWLALPVAAIGNSDLGTRQGLNPCVCFPNQPGKKDSQLHWKLKLLKNQDCNLGTFGNHVWKPCPPIRNTDQGRRPIMEKDWALPDPKHCEFFSLSLWQSNYHLGCHCCYLTAC